MLLAQGSSHKNDPANTEVIYTTVNRAEGPPESWAECYASRLYTPSYWKVLDSQGNRASNWSSSVGDSLGIGNGDVRSNWFWLYWIWEDDTYTWDNTPDTRRAPINWIEMTGDKAEIITVGDGSPEFGLPLSKEFYGDLFDTVDTWYSWPQYKTIAPTPNNRLPVGGETDWYIFRLAETYLLRAEAYFWKGELGLAVSDINTVRQRSDAPLIASGDVTIDYIFDERARELYMEEPRHTEMVRASLILAQLNRDGYSLATITDKNWYNDKVHRDNDFYTPPLFIFRANEIFLAPYNIFWPIPQSVITANTLGTINQNIGYVGAENNVEPLTTISDDE